MNLLAFLLVLTSEISLSQESGRTTQTVSFGVHRRSKIIVNNPQADRVAALISDKTALAIGPRIGATTDTKITVAVFPVAPFVSFRMVQSPALLQSTRSIVFLDEGTGSYLLQRDPFTKGPSRQLASAESESYLFTITE